MSDGDDDTTAADADPGERLTSAYPEPDPEADLPDPESELPTVPSPPAVEIPTPTRSEEDVPGELLAGFWTTVLVFNVAVLATSLGLLLLGFDVQRRLGTGALIVGLAAAVHGYLKYRSLAERHRSGQWDGDSAAGESDAGEPVYGESADDDPPVQGSDGSPTGEPQSDEHGPKGDEPPTHWYDGTDERNG